jgi:predicted dienelactone hydrolase
LSSNGSRSGSEARTGFRTEDTQAVCQDAPGFDRQAFHREFNAAVVAFFKAKLAPP